MAKYAIDSTTLTGIADAIRERAGTNAEIATNKMAEAILAIKGGMSLNVVTATALPDTVTDGQIVVITETNPGTVYIDTDEPSNPETGDVWIEVASGASAALELTGESPYLRNGLANVKQYDGNTWSLVKGYLGVAGAWVEIIAGQVLPVFSYSGEYTVKEDEDGWEISFLSSGNLLIDESRTVDVFLVGGGGGGGGGSNKSGTSGTSGGDYASGGGGGGGYTTTVKNITLYAGSEYAIEVGSGGAGGAVSTYGSGGDGKTGGTSSAFGCEAAGGSGGGSARNTGGSGGSGGSGGGGGMYDTKSGNTAKGTSGDGGADGMDGLTGVANSTTSVAKDGGVGQNTTTRAFRSAAGTLYSGGGGGGSAYQTSGNAAGLGGAGGGGDGSGYINGTWVSTSGTGEANTGGGGGGGACVTYAAGAIAGGAGGSGIVIIRNARG